MQVALDVLVGNRYGPGQGVWSAIFLDFKRRNLLKNGEKFSSRVLLKSKECRKIVGGHDQN